jgi:predicted  nucleic acid-binding Zn-ribbon protein
VGALKSSQNIGKEVAELRSELKPALDGIRDLTQSGTGLATRVEGEVQEIVRTSQRIRSEVDRGLRRAKHRLAEFDAVTEVVQEEFEETALDIAATLRTVRKGRGVIGRIRRLLRRGGRR